MNTPALDSAASQVAAIKDGKISATELLDHYLERIDRLNPKLNAIVHMEKETARERAKQADAALADNRPWGPLHGLPITIKDTFEVAGMPCTSGSPRLKNHVPQKNADAVQSLVDAGAIVFGKTNVPLFGGDFQSFNDVYGQSCNPWDTDTTPGGSSGGAAAAVAAGLSGLEIGSDIAGSIRIPAHFCGIYGHKPSYGIIPLKGHIPLMPGIFSGEYSLDIDILVAGPLARSAEDLFLAMELLVRPEQPERRAWQIALPPPRRESITNLKIAVWPDDKACPIDANVGNLFQQGVDRLAAAGAHITEAHPDIDLAVNQGLFLGFLAAVIGAGTPDKYFNKWRDEAAGLAVEDLSYKACHLRGATQLHKRWVENNALRQIFRQQWADFFRHYDILLCPAAPVTAVHHDHSYLYDRRFPVNGMQRPYMDLSAWSGLAGMAYLPATVAPIGICPGGMPAGIQIIGPYLEDRTTMTVARQLEDITGGFIPPPGV